MATSTLLALLATHQAVITQTAASKVEQLHLKGYAGLDQTQIAARFVDPFKILAQYLQSSEVTHWQAYITHGTLTWRRQGFPSEEMSQTATCIIKIAGETHLLSLNAAIEAAGAAQHGERFGVVAQEIKQLAQRSSRASEEVVGIIQEIEEATVQAQALAQTGQNKAHELQQVAQQTGELFSEVQQMTAQCEVQATSTSEVATQVKQLTQIIRTATAQQRSANQQVLEALEGLSQAAFQSSQSSKLVSSSATDLQTLSQSLQRSLN